MIRFIIRKKQSSSFLGNESMTSYLTMLLDVPQLEEVLRQGGYGEDAYEFCELVGCELVDDKKEADEQE